MNTVLKSSCLAAGAVSLALGGCAQLAFSHATDEAAPVKIGHAEDLAKSTVKSGAAVSFRHTHTGAGRRGTVAFVVSEGYDTGTLTLTATGDEEISVFGATATQTVDLSDGAEHMWSVDFEAARDGVFYLNVMAVAETKDGIIASRAYAARVQVGEVAAEKAGVDESAATTMPSGETVIMMEAEEVIQ